MYYVFLFFFLISFNYANSDNLHFADNHGPISIMGDHMHKKGEMMMSYRFVNMKMNDVLNGTKNLSESQVMSSPNGASDNSGTYMNSPISMKMDMHMFGIMYAPIDNLTLMLMSGFMEKEMRQKRMAMAGGANFDVNSSGIGDTRISGMINLHKDQNMKAHIGFGLSFPTGSIDKRDVTPASSNARLGYGMQNGSGTYDPFVFINNVNNFGRVKIGEQIYFKKPLSGKNSKNYQHGDIFDSSIWASYRWLNNVSSSLKINYNYKGKMDGYDNEMNARMSPAMDARNQGHQKVNLSFGLNFVNHNKFLENHRIGFELILPIHQRLRGIQMSDSFKTIMGWQYSF